MIDGSISINNINNLTIESLNELQTHLTFSGPSDEIKITDSKDISLINLRIGHGEQMNGCMGGVLNVSDSFGLSIEKCILYGCGVYGLKAENASNIQVLNTNIIGCSEEGIRLNNITDSLFKDCRFLYNGAKAFSLVGCDNIVFEGLYARDNGNNAQENTSDYLFNLTDCRDILLNNAVIRNNLVKQLSNIDDLPKTNNIIFKFNESDEDYFIGDYGNIPEIDETGHVFSSGILLGTSYPYKTYWIAPEGDSLKLYYEGDFNYPIW